MYIQHTNFTVEGFVLALGLDLVYSAELVYLLVGIAKNSCKKIPPKFMPADGRKMVAESRISCLLEVRNSDVGTEL